MDGNGIVQLISDIDIVREYILILSRAPYEEGEHLSNIKEEKSLEEHNTKIHQHFKYRQLLYRNQYAPRVTEIIRRGEIILGKTNPAIIEAKQKQKTAEVNFIGMENMTDSLSLVRSELILSDKFII